MDPSSFISVGITLALELRKFILGYIDVRKSEEKYLSAISDEALLIDESWSKLITFNDSVMELLNSIKDYPTVNQLYDFLQHCAESMRIYSELINSYINYSVAIKQFSVNEDLMDKLRKYKGMLYDYVQRVSETVTDENTIVIGGNFHRFIKAHQKEIFPKISKKESKKINTEAQQFMDLLKQKILPSLIKQKPRFLFREKRVKIIFSESYKKLMEDREKITINIPEDDLRELLQETISPIFIVFEELKSIEDTIPKRKKLPYRKRRR